MLASALAFPRAAVYVRSMYSKTYLKVRTVYDHIRRTSQIWRQAVYDRVGFIGTCNNDAAKSVFFFFFLYVRIKFSIEKLLARGEKLLDTRTLFARAIPLTVRGIYTREFF